MQQVLTGSAALTALAALYPTLTAPTAMLYNPAATVHPFVVHPFTEPMPRPQPPSIPPGLPPTAPFLWSTQPNQPLQPYPEIPQPRGDLIDFIRQWNEPSEFYKGTLNTWRSEWRDRKTRHHTYKTWLEQQRCYRAYLRANNWPHTAEDVMEAKYPVTPEGIKALQARYPAATSYTGLVEAIATENVLLKKAAKGMVLGLAVQ